MGANATGAIRACGIDIDKRWLWACVHIIEPNRKIKERFRQFDNDQAGIRKLRTWLKRQKVTDVAFESTGVYWQMLYDSLSNTCDVIVGNPLQMKGLRGYKTDRGDGRWIVTLLRAGAIKPSFIPPREIRELRLLTRQYHKIVQDRSRNKNRTIKTLRQVGITIDGCMSDVFCKTGRAMIEALIRGEGAEVVASLGTRLKATHIGILTTLEGAPMCANHCDVVGRYYRAMISQERETTELWSRIETAARPFEESIRLLTTIPGINRKAAIYVIAEIGVDMDVFGSVKRLSSWAGLCPGNNSSGGKRKSGRSSSGNQYLRAILAQAAWAAIRTKGSVFREFYYSNRERLGHNNKAAFAVAHKLLRVCFAVLRNKEEYVMAHSDNIAHRARNVRKQLRRATTDELLQEINRRIESDTLEMSSQHTAALLG